MSKFNAGGEPKSSGNSVFLKVEKEGTIAYLLGNKDNIRWTDKQMAVFVKSGGPCNASWVQVPNDPGLQLGIKPGYTAWIPVAVKEDGEWRVKIWQTNKTNHQAVANLESEWVMKGTRIKISMVNGRWTVAALPPAPAKFGNPTEADLDACIAAIPSDEDFGKMIGPDDAAGVKELLIKRCNVSSWGQVLAAFNVKGAEAVDDVEVEDVI